MDNLEKENEKLKEAIYTLRVENIQLAMMEEDAQKKCVELLKENAKLKEALEFYADKSNWKSGFSLKVDDTKMTETNYLRVGGKRARQALKETEEHNK